MSDALSGWIISNILTDAEMFPLFVDNLSHYLSGFQIRSINESIIMNLRRTEPVWLFFFVYDKPRYLYKHIWGSHKWWVEIRMKTVFSATVSESIKIVQCLCSEMHTREWMDGKASWFDWHVLSDCIQNSKYVNKWLKSSSRSMR